MISYISRWNTWKIKLKNLTRSKTKRLTLWGQSKRFNVWSRRPDICLMRIPEKQSRAKGGRRKLYEWASLQGEGPVAGQGQCMLPRRLLIVKFWTLGIETKPYKLQREEQAAYKIPRSDWQRASQECTIPEQCFSKYVVKDLTLFLAYHWLLFLEKRVQKNY